jgi:hypothetical protein
MPCLALADILQTHIRAACTNRRHDTALGLFGATLCHSMIVFTVLVYPPISCIVLVPRSACVLCPALSCI